MRPYIEEGVGVYTIIKGLREGRNLAMKKLEEISVQIDKSDPA
jgi:T-complex protein 1 subunit eta